MCPWNQKFSQALADDSPFPAREFIAGKDAVTLATDIMALDLEQFSAAFRKSPMKRAKLAGLRRTAGVALESLQERQLPAISRTIIREGPFRLFFPREEQRVHDHVSHPDGEAKFWIEPELSASVVVGLSPQRSPRPMTSSVVTLRRFAMPGSATSVAEVTHVSRHGFWLLLGSEELHVPFTEFPWFRAATIEQITTLEWPSVDHLYWPLLDVDLAVTSIRTPAAYPLVSQAAPAAYRERMRRFGFRLRG